MRLFEPIPLAWLGWKRRATQFGDNKNTPGIDYVALKKQQEEMRKASTAFDEPATTPGPEEKNDGDLQIPVPPSFETGPVEVSELRQSE